MAPGRISAGLKLVLAAVGLLGACTPKTQVRGTGTSRTALLDLKALAASQPGDPIRAEVAGRSIERYRGSPWGSSSSPTTATSRTRSRRSRSSRWCGRSPARRGRSSSLSSMAGITAPTSAIPTSPASAASCRGSARIRAASTRGLSSGSIWAGAVNRAASGCSRGRPSTTASRPRTGSARTAARGSSSSSRRWRTSSTTISTSGRTRASSPW